MECFNFLRCVLNCRRKRIFIIDFLEIIGCKRVLFFVCRMMVFYFVLFNRGFGVWSIIVFVNDGMVMFVEEDK